jgi:geranylgeranyl transferase type-1 subunit beta
MYTAICIWYILADDSPMNSSTDIDDTSISIDAKSEASIDIKAATNYILSCITFEGSLGLTPGREGHGGSTFCGIASLYLMGVLDDVLTSPERIGWKDDLIRWCVMRQYSLPMDDNENVMNNGFDESGDNAAGMQGRPNKLEDTCYSYWIGGTLHLLGASHLLDGWALREYVLNCQSPYGGFGKVVGAMPDLLHSFYSLAWLAISEEGRCCCQSTDIGDVIVEDDTTKFECDVQERVSDSIRRLSRLDCALGVSKKRKALLKNAADSMRSSNNETKISKVQ